jgi:hypothetical protein
MLRVTLLVLVMAAALGGACGGALTEPDAGSGGQLGGIGGNGGGGGVGNAPGGGGGEILDVRPADEPCALEVRVLPVADESCRFALPIPPCDYADNGHIGVRVGSAEIPRDPSAQDGWDYSGPTQSMIQLYGPSCDAATATAGNGVTIIYKILI